MNITIKCNKCQNTIDITQESINSDVQLIFDEMYHHLKVMHQNCDPVDMTYEDSLIWEQWNKTFHPENYKD